MSETALDQRTPHERALDALDLAERAADDLDAHIRGLMAQRDQLDEQIAEYKKTLASLRGHGQG